MHMHHSIPRVRVIEHTQVHMHKIYMHTYVCAYMLCRSFIKNQYEFIKALNPSLPFIVRETNDADFKPSKFVAHAKNMAPHAAICCVLKHIFDYPCLDLCNRLAKNRSIQTYQVVCVSEFVDTQIRCRVRSICKILFNNNGDDDDDNTSNNHDDNDKRI